MSFKGKEEKSQSAAIGTAERKLRFIAQNLLLLSTPGQLQQYKKKVIKIIQIDKLF